jgi:hypothetical protein
MLANDDDVFARDNTPFTADEGLGTDGELITIAPLLNKRNINALIVIIVPFL